MIERHGITTFGVSPTAIRLLMRGSSPQNFPMPSLRLLGSTGEPWDETSYVWFFENARQRAVSDHQHFGRNGSRRMLSVSASDPVIEGIHARSPGAADGDRGDR
jgi:hypothetical protein